MSQFDEKELSHLAKLCQIACTEEEIRKLLPKIQSVLSYVEQLQAVDTEGVQPCHTVLETHQSVVREDAEGELLSRDLFLSNAPSHVGGMVRVPTVIKFTTT